MCVRVCVCARACGTPTVKRFLSNFVTVRQTPFTWCKDSARVGTRDLGHIRHVCLAERECSLITRSEPMRGAQGAKTLAKPPRSSRQHTRYWGTHGD